jgi:NitT/TauT family transport system substrate-binding protein
MTTGHERRLRSAVLTSLVLPLVVACAGGPSPSAKNGAVAKVEVGIIPIVAVAPIALGVEKGFFKEERLDVQTHIGQGGAALVPAVVSGQYNFAFGNNVSLLVARSKGLPIRIVSAANSAGNDPDPIEEALVARNPAITSPADLAGKTIAVNTLNNIVELTIRATLQAAGVDAGTVKFVEIGFPDMPTALEQGRVDAADIAEPFLTAANEKAARIIARPFRVLQQNMYISSWFSTDAFLKANPDVTDRFLRALDRSKKYATEHPDEARATVQRLLGVSPQIAQKLSLSYWPQGLPSRDSLTILSDASVRQGLIKAGKIKIDDVLLQR